jgi:DNA-binding CsgD family transcriptional regulator
MGTSYVMSLRDLSDKHDEALRLARQGKCAQDIAEALGWDVRMVRQLLRSRAFAAQSSGTSS